MIGQKYQDMPVTQIKAGAERRLAYTDHLMMAIIDFSNGPAAQPDPPHAHPHEQVTSLLEGVLEFTLGGEVRRMMAGDVVVIPPGVPHSARAIEQCRVMDVFAPVREDYQARQRAEAAAG